MTTEIDRDEFDRKYLSFLSRFVETCRVCGHVEITYVEKDMLKVWVACRCGHVFETENTWRWH